MRPRRLKLGTHVDRFIVYTGIRLLLIHPFISSFFFLSNFQAFKRFHHTFLRNCEAWKVETWYTRKQWMDVYRNLPALAYLSLYLFLFFFLSSFQALKFFVRIFLGTVRPRRLKIRTNMNSVWMYCVYRNQVAVYSSL